MKIKFSVCVQLSKKELIDMTALQKAIQDVADQVTNTVAGEASAKKLMDSIPGLIDAAVANATTFPELVAQLGTLKTNLKDSSDALAAAVVQDTPKPPEPPPATQEIPSETPAVPFPGDSTPVVQADPSADPSVVPVVEGQ